MIDKFKGLRRRAEKTLKEKGGSISDTSDLLSLIHELEVHQVELKLQNEELERTSKDLAEQREEFVQLYESAPVGFMTVNPKGLIERANAAAAELLDVPKKLMIGRAFAKFIHADDQEKCFSLIGESNEAAVKVSGELRLAINARVIHVRLEKAAQTNQWKETVFQLALVDITRLKETEEKLRGNKNELEMRVKERTLDLLIKNLELEQSNRELEDFASVVSHDLREPLRKIQTFGERLASSGMKGFEKKDRDDLERIREAAGRMQILISELLEYSRIDSTKTFHSRLNLKEIVSDVVSDISVLLADKKGKIEISGLPEIEGNPVQMRQLFQNLIENSLKYNESERPLIRITCTPSNSEPSWAIRVEDNGIGFDERYLDRIFRPFHRLHGRKSKHKGTGMGLAICRKIVEHHGGSMDAKSAPGKGSVFIVRLPRNELKKQNEVTEPLQ